MAKILPMSSCSEMLTLKYNNALEALTLTRTNTRFAPTGQPGFGKFGADFGGGYGVPFGVSKPRYGLVRLGSEYLFRYRRKSEYEQSNHNMD